MAQKSNIAFRNIDAYLRRQKKDVLVELLMEQVRADERLCERLMMKAARGGAKKLNVETFRRAIFSAVTTDGYVHYHDTWEYTNRIHEMHYSLRELLAEGFASEVIQLAEYALVQVEEAMHSVDDSSGGMGAILQELQDLHRDACKRAKPDPEILAGVLLGWELDSEWDTFFDASTTYAKVLGKRGLARYRALVEAEWARLPALGAGEKDEHRNKRSRLTQLMESYAIASGDLDAQIEVLRRDLSSETTYLRIAELLRKAGRDEEALAWAERGREAFPEDLDSRLRDFLAEEYHRRGRHDDAMQLIWVELEESESPSLSAYQKLKLHADRVGAWPAWREKAIDLFRERIEQARKNAPRTRWQWQKADSSGLVRIFLWEKNVDAAWCEAQEGGCTEELWLQMAGLREQDHPDDALEIYRRQIDPLVGKMHAQAYQEAAAFVGRIRDLMMRHRREPEFRAYLEQVRKTHKAKRSFMALLERMT